MRVVILILFILTFQKSYSQIKWELAKNMQGYSHLSIEAFSKDTFVVASYFNTIRNGNITFEWALNLTTDFGDSWERIYQDSTTVNDIPKVPLRIDNLEVTDNSVLAFTREDGYLFTSEDYGKTWDSLLIFLPFERSALLDSYQQYIACFTNDNYIIIYNTVTKDTNHIIIPKPDIDFGGDDVRLLERKLCMRSLNEFYFLYTDVTVKKGYSYLHITEDAGKTWEIRENPRYYLDVLFLDNSIAYACGNSSSDSISKKNVEAIIDKSTDAGKTWETVVNMKDRDYPIKKVDYFDQLFEGNDIIISTIGTYNAISTEKGKDDWQFDNLEPTTYPNSGKFSDIAFDNGGKCMATFYGNFIVKYTKSPLSVKDKEKDYNIAYSYIEIYNLAGQKVLKYSNDDISTVLGLCDGLYLKVYKTKQGKVVKTEKLIITQ